MPGTLAHRQTISYQPRQPAPAAGCSPFLEADMTGRRDLINLANWHRWDFGTLFRSIGLIAVKGLNPPACYQWGL